MSLETTPAGVPAHLSIIVPVAPWERNFQPFLQDLQRLGHDVEVIFVGPDRPIDESFRTYLESHSERVRWVDAPLGRAHQLNAGVQASSRHFLWFLHLDTRFNENAWRALQRGLAENPKKLHYFYLHFLRGASRLMRINEVGLRLRSDYLGMPFGDQGFALSRTLFDEVGGFSPDLSYGEDHAFVWRLRIKGFQLNSLGEYLWTSPRKYQQDGWLSVTLRFFFMTYRQAAPYWMEWRWNGIRRGAAFFGRELKRGLKNLGAFFFEKNPSTKTSAVVVFVKTPGISNVKTRLGKTFGQSRAESFYKLSVEAVADIVSSACRGQEADSFWAIAEEEAFEHPLWKRDGWNRIRQGEGGLGDRLHRVYSKLIRKYDLVLFLGADAPQISEGLINDAISLLHGERDFAFGPAEDGGFYLFGGRKPIPATIWRSVPYSQSNTLEELCKLLTGIGTIESLSSLADVDTETELYSLKEEFRMRGKDELSKNQLSLVEWLEGFHG